MPEEKIFTKHNNWFILSTTTKYKVSTQVLLFISAWTAKIYAVYLPKH